MLDFCSDRGFFSLTALDLSPGTGGRLFRLRRAAIDFIADLLAALIPQYSIFPFLSSKIAAVAMNRFFLLGKQLRCHGHIVDIGSSDPQGMHQPSVPVHANGCLVAEVPSVSFFVECASLSRFFSAFLVLDGAEIRVESTIVPFRYPLLTDT